MQPGRGSHPQPLCRGAPLLGGDNMEVLTELGYTPEEIGQMMAELAV